MQLQMPDYDNSILALTSSVMNHFGVKNEHKTLPLLDKMLKKQYKNVVVMLFDGLGKAIIDKHLPEKSFLRSHYCATISSVFPPTTTAATTTMETGLSPIEHSWLGWKLYFDEIGDNVNIFLNTISGSNGVMAADYNVAQKYLHYKTLFDRINEGGKYRAERVSTYSDYKAKSIPEICETVVKLCREDGEKYIYTYWNQPDYNMHGWGTLDARIHNEIVQIDDYVCKLCEKLSDTLVIVTADHGLIDTSWRYFEDYPDLTDCFAHLPTIEARALSFFIKSDRKAEFERLFLQYFGDCYKLYSHDEVMQLQLFGDGKMHKMAEGFIGDYLAAAVSDVSIEYLPREKSHSFLAAHAGLTDEEMNVPFIAVECGK